MLFRKTRARVNDTRLLVKWLFETVEYIANGIEYFIRKVHEMTEASAQVRQDIADIKSKIAGLTDAYTNAAAARLQKALDDQKAAIEAESAADLDAAHKDAQDVIAALQANQPITPPATSSEPSPAPVPSPADPAAGDAPVA